MEPYRHRLLYVKRRSQTMKSSAKEMVMFRNSRKGYDKNDVNRYIEDMNIRFTTAENRYVSTIRMLEQDLENARRVPDLSSQLDKANSDNDELRARIADAEAELLRAKEELEQAKAELEKQRECPVKTEFSVSETESKLGSILVKANLDAQKILSDAEEESRRKITEAERTAESIRFDAAVNARMMTESTKKELSSLTEEYMKSLTALSEESAGEYRRLCDELKVKFEAAQTEAKGKLGF